MLFRSQEDPLEDAPPPEMLRDEETQDYNNIPHGDDNLVDEKRGAPESGRARHPISSRKD